MFSLRPEEYAAKPVPSVTEWQELWKVWDTVTRQMIPDEELLEKPIKLRNACIFYLGHIPTFLDMQLTKATGKPATEPEHYPKIFERGIDPDVEDPEQCHAHSEIPDSWPPIEEILEFQRNVRKRTEDLYTSGEAYTDRKIGRALWLVFEHEVMHLETLLYMLVQSDKTVPPTDIVNPDFQLMAKVAKHAAVPNQWIKVPETTITLGLPDEENNEGPDRYFGWDNEKPPRKTPVHAFEAKARPITNGEYAEYLESHAIHRLPASWAEAAVSTNGANGHSNGASNGASGPSITFVEGKAVRTVFGKVALKHALDWPVMASYDELAGCAQWMGGRIPTQEETRSIYAYAEERKLGTLEKSLGRTIPAVNGYGIRCVLSDIRG